VISAARRLAFDVLSRVEGGAWASEVLAGASAGLDSRDAGLATEIVFGTLRHLLQLDFLIGHFGKRDPEKLDPAVRLALRTGIYQLRYMDRIPAHAAVGESVELVKQGGQPQAAGLVNAILRRVTREPVDWHHREIALSTPLWLLEGWDKQFGKETADRIAAAFLERPQTYVRNPPQGHGLELEATEVPGAWRVLAGDPRGLRIQDVGSQSIVPLLELRAGMTFLDVCAAPGNKTAQALEAGVQAVAADRHVHRLRQFGGCPQVALDATAGLPFRRPFDRILVDAPCSGTGTLGRNPEIKWRLAPSDIRDLHGRQVRILRNSLDLLAPGGRLVYSTCALERKENEEVVARAVKPLASRFQVAAMERRTPGVDAGDGFFAAVVEGCVIP
jgi:16S rRNA (cytosine967-C5)-methyltransferase